jgi:hypothetical protein
MPGAWRWKDFTIETIGHEYHVMPPDPPIFNRKWLDWFQRIEQHDEDGHWTLFNGYHVTHVTGWSMIMHWWPSHNLIFTVRDFEPTRDFQSLEQFLKLFKPETRGAPKITEAAIKGAVTKIIPPLKPTQAATAKVLEVSESALEKWRQRNGIKTWKEVVERLS